MKSLAFAVLAIVMAASLAMTPVGAQQRALAPRQQFPRGKSEPVHLGADE